MSRVPGYIIFAHGSRVESANESVRLLAREFADLHNDALVEAAFLELGEPNLAAAVARLSTCGATDICVLPYFLTLGLHLQRDLPQLAAEAAAQHPTIAIHVAQPLDGHPALAQILLDRAMSWMGIHGASK